MINIDAISRRLEYLDKLSGAYMQWGERMAPHSLDSKARARAKAARKARRKNRGRT